MATVITIGTGGTISATAPTLYELGDTGPETVGTMTIQLVGSSPVGFSITVQGRVRRSQASGLGYVAIPYKKHYLNGAVGDETYVSTAITSDSIIAVDATGLDIALNVTAATSGSFALYISRVLG